MFSRIVLHQPGDNLSNYLGVLRRRPALGELVEVDVEPVHGVHPSVAGEALELEMQVRNELMQSWCEGPVCR